MYILLCNQDHTKLRRMADSKKGRGDVRIYSCIDDLTTELAEYISDLSEKSVKERGCFSVALSGRSTINLIW